MKSALFAAVSLFVLPGLALSQELRTTALDATELADKLGIYIRKFNADFNEPVFATIFLHEGEKESSFETTRAAKEFSISFDAIPSEIAVKEPKHISFHGNVTGMDGTEGTFASVNRSLDADPRMFRDGFSVGSPYLEKQMSSSQREPKNVMLLLNEEICLFDYTITGQIDKAPARISVRGSIIFSKTPRKKP